MQIIKTDVAIIGAGGSGLRAAIEIAENHPELDIALISKVYPMRSHTVAAEGGAAAAIQDHDSLEYHEKRKRIRLQMRKDYKETKKEN